MPGTCLNSWQTDACEWSAGYVWRSSDWIERAILISFALMFAYNAFVVIRFALRCSSARRECKRFELDDFSILRRISAKLFADLSPGVGMLRGIASAAPFLGLAGTSYGILAGLSFGYSGTPSGYIALMCLRVSATLITTVIGILVAIPATLSHNLLRSRIEDLSGLFSPRRNRGDLGSFHFAQTLLLKKRFSYPPVFALLAAPVLIYAVSLYMTLEPYVTPSGVSVALPSFPCHPEVMSDRLVVLSITNAGKMFINLEPTDRTDLPTRLSAIYSLRTHRELYLLAEDEVSFQMLAEAIDTVKNSQGAGLNPLDIKVQLITPQAEAEREKCYALVLERLRPRTLRKSE